MKRFSTIILALLVTVGMIAPALAQPRGRRDGSLAGYFTYECPDSDGRDGVLLDAEIGTGAGGKLAFGMTAGHPDGHGAAPDGSGEGKVGSDGVLHFSFEDSFFNRGTGTFQRVGPGRYRLEITITQVKDSRCLAYYGAHVLKRDTKYKLSPDLIPSHYLFIRRDAFLPPPLRKAR